MLTIFRSVFSVSVAALALLLTPPAYAVEYIDYTDIWVDTNPPTNSGMGGFGINFAQSGNSFDYIFATFFVYDPATGSPVWVTGEMTRDSGKTSFTGNIYRTQGEPTTSPFAPKNTVTRAIGTVKFTPSSSTTGTLVYAADGMKEMTLKLIRLNLTENVLNGTYQGRATIRRSSCASSGNNGTTFNRVVLDVEKRTGSTQATYLFAIENYDCTLSGTLIQEGRFQKINNAKYVCYIGKDKIVDGTANLFNITPTTQGIEGEWTSNKGVGNCKEEAQFMAILQP